MPRPIVERLATPDHLFVVKDKDSAFFRTSDTFYALFPHVNSAVIISKEMSALVQKYADQAIKLGLDSYLVIFMIFHFALFAVWLCVWSSSSTPAGWAIGV